MAKAFKVLASDNIAPEGKAVLDGAPGIEADVRAKVPPEELKSIIQDYDALIVRSATQVTAEVIGLAERLKVIGRAGTGVDNIDLSAATKKGIVVMNTPGGNTLSAAEHTIAMVFALARHIPQASHCTKGGRWEKGAADRGH